MTDAVANDDFLGAPRIPSSGLHFIEASAGTGKTYSLAETACRLVAENDLGVGELLVVTFTKDAAAELRNRIRERMREQSSTTSTVSDVGRERLARALGEYDRMTVATIHSFCQTVLASASVATDSDAVAGLVDGDDCVLDEAVNDTLAALALEAEGNESGWRVPTWGLLDHAATLPTADLVRATAAALIANPNAVLYPPSGGGSAEAVLVAAAARRTAETVVRRRNRLNEVTFDSLLVDTEALIRGGGAVVDALRTRFRAVMIDEFQDTDEIQWSIFRQLFVDRPDTLVVVVGDPKQAIYRFRGGDIHTYLSARDSAGATRWSLRTNRRSDPALIDGLNFLFDGAVFGDPRIPYVRVEAPDDSVGGLFYGESGEPFPAVDARFLLPAEEHEGAPATRRAILDDLVDAVREIGGGGIEVRSRSAPRCLDFGDVCVLVRTHAQAAETLAALRRGEVPAVAARPAAVTSTAAMDQWQEFIWALERPTDPKRVRSSCLGWFVGRTLEEFLDSETLTDDYQRRYAEWARLLETEGVAALLRSVRRDTDLEGRLLAHVGGERQLTDLYHIGELLIAETGGRGVAAVVAADHLAAFRGSSSDESDRRKGRSEGQRAAVQVLTVHASKGLEFPVVLVPFSWSEATQRRPRMFTEKDGGRALDVETTELRPPYAVELERRIALARAESDGETARLIYVALTRAKNHLAFWVPPKSGRGGRSAGFDGLFVPPGLMGEPSSEAFVAQWAAAWSQGPPGTVAHIVKSRHTAAADRSGSVERDVLRFRAAQFDSPPPRCIGRWSFTSVIRAADQLVAEPARPPSGLAESADGWDEPAARGGVDAGRGEGGASTPTLFDPTMAGTAFGTLVHAVFEDVDFAASDPSAAISDALRQRPEGATLNLDGEDRTRLVGALAAVLDSPLGVALGGATLGAVPAGDRLNEMDFELPIVGQRGLVAHRIAAAMRRLYPSGSPLADWAAGLGERLASLNLDGYLTGSIDLVLRTTSGAEPPRFHVIDYKTNLLSAFGTADTLDAYEPDRLINAMAEHDYPLQALLYAVALHRYLAFRVADYDPAVHLGSCGYLFVRGMIGRPSARPSGDPVGVCSWPIDTDVVLAVSAALAGEESW